MNKDNGTSQDYIVATSSTSDLPREWLEEHHVPFISYSFTVNGDLRQDDCSEEGRRAMFSGMRKGDDLRTSMINEYTYYEFFKSLMETGKNVLFLDMSEKMSVSYVNANSAAGKIAAEFPDRTLRVLDTRCISGGLGLLVMGAVKHMEAGESFEQVTEWCEANKLKIAHRFTVDDLNYLKRGGRVSNASALVGSLLNIKPVLYVPDGGTLDVVKKARGRHAALRQIRDSGFPLYTRPAREPSAALDVRADDLWAVLAGLPRGESCRTISAACFASIVKKPPTGIISTSRFCSRLTCSAESAHPRSPRWAARIPSAFSM